MFPDPTIIWRPLVSEIDGIFAPFVLDGGMWRGERRLVVVEAPSGRRAYGVAVECLAYAAYDEMVHSIASHGEGLAYDGGVYIKEAQASVWLKAHTEADPLARRLRHFALVGTEICCEFISVAPPRIVAFSEQDEAYDWAKAQD